MTDWHATFDFELGPLVHDESFVLGFEVGRLYACLQTGLPFEMQIHEVNFSRAVRMIGKTGRGCMTHCAPDGWVELAVDGAA